MCYEARSDSAIGLGQFQAIPKPPLSEKPSYVLWDGSFIGSTRNVAPVVSIMFKTISVFLQMLVEFPVEHFFSQSISGASIVKQAGNTD